MSDRLTVLKGMLKIIICILVRVPTSLQSSFHRYCIAAENHRIAKLCTLQRIDRAEYEDARECFIDNRVRVYHGSWTKT
jgi:putative ribosome biogenesis GTPase RsgA